MDAAYPIRFWWLKRLSSLLAALALALVGFHWWMTWMADARLERIVDGWRQDPEAPLPEMLLPGAGFSGIATGQENAAFHYTRAINGLPPLTQKQQDEWDNAEGPQSPLPPEKAELVRGIVTAVAPQLAIAREARGLETIDWDRPAMGITGIGVNWNGVRVLAIRLGWAMVLAHHDGDIASAMEYGRDAHQLGYANIFDGPCLVSGLVSTGVQALAASRFIDVAWHRPHGMSEEEERAAWRAAAPEVRAAIAELLDEEQGRTIMRLSWKGERLMSHSALKAGWALGLPISSSNVIMAPVTRADIARLLEIQDQMAAAASTGDAQSIFDAAVIDRMSQPQTLAGNIASMLFWVTAPATERANISFLRTIAHRRAAAVVLAAKLYHAEHGRWPDSLEELAPAYLPRVPQDPFAPPGTPMGFRTDMPLPVVYSIGEDLKDDGGSPAPPASASSQQVERLRTGGWANSFERRDIVFPLYLPPEYFELREDFNLWHYLESPQEEVERARKARQQRLEEERRRQNPAE